MSENTGGSTAMLKTTAYFHAPAGTPVMAMPADHDQARAILCPGDIGISISGTRHLMQAAYGLPYGHAFMYVDNGEIVEALAKRVTKDRLSRYDNANYAIVRWKHSTPAQGLTMAKIASQYIGDKYDYPQLIYMSVRGLLHALAWPLAIFAGPGVGLASNLTSKLMDKRNILDRDNKKICSEVIADASRQVGFPVESLGHHGMIAPAHFADTRFFDFIFVHPRTVRTPASIHGHQLLSQILVPA